MVHSRREKNQEKERAIPRKKQTRKERRVNLSTDQQRREEEEEAEVEVVLRVVVRSRSRRRRRRGQSVLPVESLSVEEFGVSQSQASIRRAVANPPLYRVSIAGL